MRTFCSNGFVFLLVAICSAISIPQRASGDVESLLAEINRKPADQRLKVLIEGARKERVLHYYGSTSLSDTQDLIKGFNKHYPFVEVRYTRLGGVGVANKVINEYRAGVYTVDLISLRGTFIPDLIDRNIVVKYQSPMVTFLRKGFADAEGYLAGIYAAGYTMIYNTVRVRSDEIPRSYEDLLNPRWKGRLAMDNEGYDWFAGMIDLLGENRASTLVKRLVEEQGVNFLRGGSHTHMTQLVAVGEHDLLIDGYVHNAVDIKAKGAPIDFVFTRPTIVKPPSVVAITSKAPHPYAAALLEDYKLSKESQEIMAHRQARWTTRRDVKWLTEPDTEIHVVSPLKWGRRYNDVVALFRKITGQ